MQLLKNIVKKILGLYNIELRRVPRRPNPIHAWDEDVAFSELYEKIKPYTLVDKKRCFMLYQLAEQALSLGGEAAEVGVYKGGTAYLLSTIFTPTKKELSIFDTFSGMPDTDAEKDLHQKGDFSDVTADSVKGYLKEFGQTAVFQGFFPDTGSAIKDRSFSFVHIDVDIYKSVMDCCEFFYPRLVTGGILIFDDYGFVSCPGAKKAVDEFFSEKKEKPVYLPTGQCMVIKI